MFKARKFKIFGTEKAAALAFLGVILTKGEKDSPQAKLIREWIFDQGAMTLEAFREQLQAVERTLLGAKYSLSVERKLIRTVPTNKFVSVWKLGVKEGVQIDLYWASRVVVVSGTPQEMSGYEEALLFSQENGRMLGEDDERIANTAERQQSLF